MTHDLATIENLTQLDAMLAAITGSAGVSELTNDQLNAMLCGCRRLVFELLHDLDASSVCA